MRSNIQAMMLLFLSAICCHSVNASQPINGVKFNIPEACPGIKTKAEIRSMGGAFTLLVTFIGKRPTDAMADKASRTYLASAIKRSPGHDMAVSTWFRAKTSDSPAMDEMIHPYPGWSKSSGVALHKALYYRVKSGSVSVE
ncbi:hypothetical protein [Geothrix sp. PMB-07]|uniref:hypothetical protein n=1 Tax=Geothrix sp. PMB-07 TaxID=3068640 RepID=UPI0027421835|nr:hypothetical protein [Geothrix sp. PMB-07]WLT32726.1 hypothetical protein Q9293_05185 [Geothrix sp. PMB-07]